MAARPVGSDDGPSCHRSGSPGSSLVFWVLSGPLRGDAPPHRKVGDVSRGEVEKDKAGRGGRHPVSKTMETAGLKQVRAVVTRNTEACLPLP